jgi:hypothetical protein
MYKCSSSWLARSLLAKIFCCILFASNISTIKAQQDKKQNRDWKEIVQLYERGWTKMEERNFGDSEENFRQAVHQLKQYRSHYVKDQNSLSFLRATYMLGEFSEWANMDKEALAFYKAALLIHPLASSPEEKSEIKLITQEAEERLSIVKRRSSSKSSSKDFPRISIGGGSKGGIRDVPKRETLFQP